MLTICRNEAGGSNTALPSTLSASASAAFKCSSVPRANSALEEAKVSAPGEESEKMTVSELEELCARYGGYMRAMRAATIIQQTYRQHSMSRSFAKLRLEAGESRRSQRFARRRGLDSCHQDSIDVDRSLDLSRLCDEKIEDDHLEMHHQTGSKDDQPSVGLKDGAGKGSSGAEVVDRVVRDTTAENVPSVGEFHGHDDLEDCGDHSSSTASLSPPLPPPSDLPSVYFESSLEDETVCRQHRICSGHTVEDCVLTVCPASHLRECPSYFHHRPLRCYNDRLDFGICRHRTSHQTNHRTPSKITTRHSDPTFGPPHPFPVESSLFDRFDLLSVRAEPSPVWKHKSGSLESYDAVVGTSLEEWDVDTGQSGRVNRPLSEVYPGSTTSSEDTGSISSGDAVLHNLIQSHHHHAPVNHINHSVNSSSSNRSSILSHSSDRQRKRAYRIGLNLFNR